MDWNSEQIRQLRQRCGWSVAEMARHLGCRTETVKNFEQGQMVPDPEVCHQFETIRSRCESNAAVTLQLAQADQQITGRGLDQICRDDFEFSN